MTEMLYPRDEVYADKIREIISADLGGRSVEPAHLVPHIYLGSQRNAESLRLLRKLGVTHVLNCAGYKGPKQFPEKSPYQGLSIDYYEFKAEDHDCYDITQHFREAFNYMDKVKREGGICLVHCAMGINRSAATCVAYLMMHSNMTLLVAVKHVKRRRRVVLSNAGFRRQLIRFARMKKLLDTIPPEENTRVAPYQLHPNDELYMSFTRGCFIDRTSDRSAMSYRDRDADDRESIRSGGSVCSVPSLRSPSVRSAGVGEDRVTGDNALNFLYDRFMNREKV